MKFSTLASVSETLVHFNPREIELISFLLFLSYHSSVIDYTGNWSKRLLEQEVLESLQAIRNEEVVGFGRVGILQLAYHGW